MKNFLMISLTLLSMTSALAAEKKAAAPAKRSAVAPAAPATAPHKAYSREYGMAGCGLGSVLMGKREGQIFAATTNGTSGNQTFAISTGTLNCVDSGNADVASRVDRFVVANRVALASDIARGRGETLASLSAMLNCADSASLSVALQSNFTRIFPMHEVVPNEVTDSIITVIQSDQNVAGTCQSII